MPGTFEGPVTILFTDVEGSTDLRTRRGDAAAHVLLQAHEQLVRSCVQEHGGREVKALGDGFMVASRRPGRRSPAPWLSSATLRPATGTPPGTRSASASD